MSTGRLEGLDHTVRIAHEWINTLDEEGGANRTRTYRLLRAVLHALRRPATKLLKSRRLSDFLRRIDRAFEMDPIADSERALRTVRVSCTRSLRADDAKDAPRHRI
jgi:uncharacterized protein (DUF2267 family)